MMMKSTRWSNPSAGLVVAMILVALLSLALPSQAQAMAAQAVRDSVQVEDRIAASFVGVATGTADMSQSARRGKKRKGSVSMPLANPRSGVDLPKIAGPDDENLPLVVIDAGHGGHDPGAISPHTGVHEKDVTLAIAQAVYRELLESGQVRVALTRSDDRYLVLEERYGIAQRLKADLFISIHADASKNHQASGASIYTLSEVASDREAEKYAERENRANFLNGVDLGRHSSDVTSILLDLTRRETMNISSDFARLLQREMPSKVKFRAHAHRFAAFVVLKAPDTPSILFETGFLSNRKDVRFLASRAGRARIAEGIRKAVQVHFARQIAMR